MGPRRQSCLFCLKDADGYCNISFLNFKSQFPFWANLCANCMPTLVLWISNFKFLFSNLGQKKSKLFVLSKRCHTWYLEDADSYFNIYCLNFKLKIHFWSNLDQKSLICPFYLKISTLGIWRMRILIPRLVFWILKAKSI